MLTPSPVTPHTTPPASSRGPWRGSLTLQHCLSILLRNVKSALLEHSMYLFPQTVPMPLYFHIFTIFLYSLLLLKTPNVSLSYSKNSKYHHVGFQGQGPLPVPAHLTPCGSPEGMRPPPPSVTMVTRYARPLPPGGKGRPTLPAKS